MPTEKDYYEILGVSKTASAEEIKKAYRKLAMQHHPDRNQGDKASEEKFKEVTEAYEVLSDPEKKRMYDQFGHSAFTQQGFGGAGAGAGGAGGFGFEDIFRNTGFGGFEDIFDSFFGGGRSRSQGRQSAAKPRGSDIRADINLEMSDILSDKNLKIKVRRNEPCDQCRGTGSKSGGASATCPTCHGTGVVRNTQGFFSVSTTCPKCHGAGTVISDPCTKCRGTGVTEKDEIITVKIPAGVDDGMRLRISGEGDIGHNGGPRGDLYVIIHIDNKTGFERKGADLFGKLKISFARAVFGGDVEVDTIDGKRKVNIPAGVQVGHQVRLRGDGIPDIRTKSRGDIFYEVVIDVPRHLNPGARKSLKDFAESMGENI